MGAAAGLMTKSNKLGFVGAFPMGWTVTFINAFELGAQSTNPKAETIVSWTFSWADSAKEAAATDALINQGVDVITMHVDAPGTIIQTAEARGVYSIGINSVAAQQFAPKYWLSGFGFTLGGKMTWLTSERDRWINLEAHLPALRCVGWLYGDRAIWPEGSPGSTG